MAIDAVDADLVADVGLGEKQNIRSSPPACPVDADSVADVGLGENQNIRLSPPACLVHLQQIQSAVLRICRSAEDWQAGTMDLNPRRKNTREVIHLT